MNTEILVIEDDDLVRQGIVDILELKGWNAVAVKSCSEALVRIRGEEYMLYVLDMKLPDGNGIMLCREIRRYTDNPILFLSAYDSEEFIVEGFEAGANDYVIKPFRTFEFIARIKALLRRTGMQNGKKVKKGLRVIVIPATQKIYLQAMEEGLLKTSESILQGPNIRFCAAFLQTHRILLRGSSCWTLFGISMKIISMTIPCLYI